MDTPKKKNSFWKRLRNKYRLVILNDQTYEEITSLRLSRFNLYLVFSTLAVFFIILTTLAIIFTPLKEYIPGYGDINMRHEIMDMKVQVDSLADLARQQHEYIQNINAIVNGTVGDKKPDPPQKKNPDPNAQPLNLGAKTAEDAELRKEMESREKFTVNTPATENKSISHTSTIADFYFFSPVKGIITNNSNSKKNHFGVDIATAKNETVKATLDGMVILSDWTLETGYTLSIQHSNNIISTYKHNSALYKKVGNFVHAGDVIAIVGNTGELSQGPHLHFELWYNGTAVNPKDFINFN